MVSIDADLLLGERILLYQGFLTEEEQIRLLSVMQAEMQKREAPEKKIYKCNWVLTYAMSLMKEDALKKEHLPKDIILNYYNERYLFVFKFYLALSEIKQHLDSINKINDSGKKIKEMYKEYVRNASLDGVDSIESKYMNMAYSSSSKKIFFNIHDVTNAYGSVTILLIV